MATFPPAASLIEERDGENLVSRVAEFFLESDIDGERAREARDFVAHFIDITYGEPCFEHSLTMSSAVSPNLLQAANLFYANVAALVDEENDLASLSMLVASRVLEESYPSAGRREYTQIIGIVTSLLLQAHPGQIELLGALSSLRQYFFRKAGASAKAIAK